MLTKRLLFFVIFLTLISGAHAAKVHGTLYAWSDFEKPLKNAIIEVNSTPAQSKVATNGEYSFELPHGSYLLRAKYYQNNVLEYIAEEEIKIDREGNFTIDLLLFPPTEQEYEFIGDINLTEIKGEDGLSNYFLLLPILLFSGVIIFYLFRKRKAGTSEPVIQAPENAESKIEELPEDLKEIHELILKKGGRVTQKELRKEMKYSEAKVSLMLDDLEDRGLIKKIKKGRANIIIVKEKS